MFSCAHLLTAYGESGRSWFSSVIGTSCSKTSPNSSLDPATCTLTLGANLTRASNRLIWELTLLLIISAG